MDPLPSDLGRACEWVYAQVPRLLTLQDRDPDSPMRGCLHPAYWRDKSSDLADMRRQEAALTFAWLWRHPLPGNPWVGERDLLRAAARALGFWVRQQNADGTFDEWYRGEHGHAATAFSTTAMSLALEALDDDLDDDLRTRVRAALKRSSSWLLTHDDHFKTNHQAVAVAALGAASRVLGDPALEEAGARKAQGILDGLHEEGWAREITGADVGYSHLLCEYLALFVALTGRKELLAGIARPWSFATAFSHPDLTAGAEYGICANPYFSRAAVALLAPHDGLAAGWLEWMRSEASHPDLSATLHDDLRLARYAFQPLLAALLLSGHLPRADRVEATLPSHPLPFEAERGDRFCPEAGLLAVQRPGYAAWAAPAHGGFVRAHFRRGDRFSPHVAVRGYSAEARGRRLRTARYDRTRRATWDGECLRLSVPLAALSFVMPPYWARVGLRVATSTPYGPKWSRWLIDRWRARKGTALNQSAAGVGGGKEEHLFEREIRFEDDAIHFSDRLVSRRRGLAPEACWLSVDGDLRGPDGQHADEDRRLPAAPFLHRARNKEVEIAYTLRATEEGARLLPAEDGS